MRRNWKWVQPNSMTDAFRLCKDFALEKKRLSVERIAELLAINADLLYKYLANGRMPAVLIPAYEHICGCNFVTRWLAASSGHLMVAMSSGQVASDVAMHDLQAGLNDAIGQLLQFYAGKASADETLAAVRQGIEGLSWHHRNVQHFETPELELGAAK